MRTRDNAMVTFPSDALTAEKRGHFIMKDGTLAEANGEVFGVITDVLPNGGDASIAVCAGGFAGTVKVKLGGNASLGDYVGSNADGEALKSATKVCAQVLEDGVAGELVEAVIFKTVKA